MTEAKQRQVLENLRRIDWLAASQETSLTLEAVYQKASIIRHQINETIALIEQPPKEKE